jgi:NAD(P)-dependent dehydrogenase (short-subunit alcohol dehydrogenase family)
MTNRAEPFDLAGKVAVVTGAASGIGLALVEALAAHGASVVMGDIAADALREQRERLASEGHEVHDVVTDVRDPSSVDALAGAGVARFGNLDIAVNNAGVVNRGVTWELPLEEWHRVVDVNLWGVVHGVRSFVPRILDSGRPGHVVNVASMAAVLPVGRLGPYTVAKHGVLGLSDVLRLDLERISAPVGVSVVLPGRIRTGMNPVGEVTAATVAANVLDAIRHNRPYVYTDDHSCAEVADRLERLVTARDDVIRQEDTTT